MFGTIRHIDKRHIEECVEVIRRSFQTVAEEFGITAENAPGTWPSPPPRPGVCGVSGTGLALT